MQTIPPVLTAAALADLTRARPDVRLLDVRTPGEYATAHVPGSYNVPLAALSEHGREISTVDAPVVLICRSGQRARQAEAALAAAGMQHLHVLDGGLQAWDAAGLPVRRRKGPISLERQVRIAAGAIGASGALLALALSPLFAIIPLVIGSGLLFAGLTDTCGMAIVLSRLPYNRGAASCDVGAMVRALNSGRDAGTP